MDKLEKHIKGIRKELDIHQPGNGLWQRIESTLPERVKSMRAIMWRTAAAVIIVVTLLAGVAIMLRVAVRINDPHLAEAAEARKYYDGRIRELWQEAEPLLTANPEISGELTLDMDELDELSAQIIKDLNDKAATSEVIEALIANYLLRIELLEDMLCLMKENYHMTEKNNRDE